MSGKAEGWLTPGSPLSAKLGCSQRPIKMLYNHIRLCLHSVPLKPVSHPDSELFLQRTRLQSLEGSDILSKCLKKVSDPITCSPLTSRGTGLCSWDYPGFRRRLARGQRYDSVLWLRLRVHGSGSRRCHSPQHGDDQRLRNRHSVSNDISSRDPFEHEPSRSGTNGPCDGEEVLRNGDYRDGGFEPVSQLLPVRYGL